MLARIFLLAVVGVVAIPAVSNALSSGTPPSPESTRPCGSRGDGNRPQALPTPAGERLGPLVIWPTIRAGAQIYRTSEGPWAFYVKAPIVLPARARVTLAVPSEAAHLIGLYTGGSWVSSVRFEACNEGVHAYSGAYDGTVGKYTGFPFGFGLARRSMCVPLDVWVDGRATPIRRTIPVGRTTCR